MMAWIFPEHRCCPSCGFTDRILVMHTQDKRYRLSCGWCANLSDRVEGHEAFFEMWEAPPRTPGTFMDLMGVPHAYRGKYIESVPIRVFDNGQTVMVVPGDRKDAA